MKKEEQPKGQSEADESIDVSMMPDISKNESPILDEEWLSLTQDWQAQPFEKTDMSALVNQTKRRTYWAKALLALDVIATVFIFVMFIYGFYAEKWSTATQMFFFFSGVGSTIYVYYEFKIRLNTWNNNCGSPEKAIEHAIASCESSIKFIKLVKFSFWLMLPAMNWYIYTVKSESEKSFFLPLIIVNLMILITWFITHVFHKKRMKELKELSQI